MNIVDVRTLFPVTRERAYLFAGGIAPASERMLQASKRYERMLAADPHAVYDRRKELPHRARRLFARLLGADEEEVAITDCTGTGSNLAVELTEAGAGFAEGANVVLDDLAYPSSVYPWTIPSRAHVERRFVGRRADGRIHLEDLEAAVDESTVAVSLSHVSQETGFRHDLREAARLAHSRGAVLMVDAMQSVGAVRLRVREIGVDFLSCGAMKWLLGAPGVGFFFAAREHLDGVPLRVGYRGARGEQEVPETGTVQTPWSSVGFRPESGARRCEVGMWGLPALAASIPGLELLLDLGMEQVESRVLDLAGYCIACALDRGLRLLTPQAAEQRGGIVAIALETAAADARAHLRRRGVDVYATGGILRVDPHIYNNRDDIDRFYSVLDGYERQAGG